MKAFLTLLSLMSISLSLNASASASSQTSQSGSAILDGSSPVAVTLNLNDDGTASTIVVDGISYKVYRQSDSTFLANSSGAADSMNENKDPIVIFLVLKASSTQVVQRAINGDSSVSDELSNKTTFKCVAGNNAIIEKIDRTPKEGTSNGQVSTGNCLTLK